MTDTVLQSFCERCGTRYSVPQPADAKEPEGGRPKLGRFGRKASKEEAAGPTTAPPSNEGFAGTFHFCLDCRQYTCTNCWNADAGACVGCRPPGAPDPRPTTTTLAARKTAAWPAGDVAGASGGAARMAPVTAQDSPWAASPTSPTGGTADAGATQVSGAMEVDEWGRPKAPAAASDAEAPEPVPTDAADPWRDARFTAGDAAPDVAPSGLTDDATDGRIDFQAEAARAANQPVAAWPVSAKAPARASDEPAPATAWPESDRAGTAQPQEAETTPDGAPDAPATMEVDDAGDQPVETSQGPARVVAASAEPESVAAETTAEPVEAPPAAADEADHAEAPDRGVAEPSPSEDDAITDQDQPADATTAQPAREIDGRAWAAAGAVAVGAKAVSEPAGAPEASEDEPLEKVTDPAAASDAADEPEAVAIDAQPPEVDDSEDVADDAAEQAEDAKAGVVPPAAPEPTTRSEVSDDGPTAEPESAAEAVAAWPMGAEAAAPFDLEARTAPAGRSVPPAASEPATPQSPSAPAGTSLAAAASPPADTTPPAVAASAAAGAAAADRPPAEPTVQAKPTGGFTFVEPATVAEPAGVETPPAAVAPPPAAATSQEPVPAQPAAATAPPPSGAVPPPATTPTPAPPAQQPPLAPQASPPSAADAPFGQPFQAPGPTTPQPAAPMPPQPPTGYAGPTPAAPPGQPVPPPPPPSPQAAAPPAGQALFPPRPAPSANVPAPAQPPPARPANVPYQPQPARAGSRACADCGLPLSAQARFCRRCGAPQA